jgi:DNA-binding PadR family transcriptional regulator
VTGERGAEGAAGEPAGRPGLPVTGWAVLGLLSFGRELSGYDMKKWADRSMGLFFWSPSFSQIYSELKRLEAAGLAVSRTVEQSPGPRSKRCYAITEAGRAALRSWARQAPVDPMVLKHGPLLRLWLGHLQEPEQMRGVLAQHIQYAEAMRRSAEQDIKGAQDNEEWVYPAVALKWAERYYRSERALAEAMLEDLEQIWRERGEGPQEPADGGRPA